MSGSGPGSESDARRRVGDFLTLILANVETPLTPARLMRVLFLVDVDLARRGVGGSGAGWSWWPAGPWSTTAWMALESLMTQGVVYEEELEGRRVLRLNGEAALARGMELDGETTRAVARAARGAARATKFTRLDEAVKKAKGEAKKLGLLPEGTGEG